MNNLKIAQHVLNLAGEVMQCILKNYTLWACLRPPRATLYLAAPKNHKDGNGTRNESPGPYGPYVRTIAGWNHAEPIH